MSIRPYDSSLLHLLRELVPYLCQLYLTSICDVPVCMLKRLFGRSSEDSQTSATGSYYFARPISNVTLDLADRQRGDRLNDDEY